MRDSLVAFHTRQPRTPIRLPAHAWRVVVANIYHSSFIKVCSSAICVDLELVDHFKSPIVLE